MKRLIVFLSCSATLLLSPQTVEASRNSNAESPLLLCIKALKRLKDPSLHEKFPFAWHVNALQAAIANFSTHPSHSADFITHLYGVYPTETLEFLTDFSESTTRPFLQKQWAYTRITELSRHFPAASQERIAALKTAQHQVENFLDALRKSWDDPDLHSSLVPIYEIRHSEMSLFAAHSLDRLYLLDKVLFKEKLKKLKAFMDTSLKSMKKANNSTDTQVHIISQLYRLAEQLGQNTHGREYAESVLEIFSTDLTPDNILAMHFIQYWKPRKNDKLASKTIQSLLKRLYEDQGGRYITTIHNYQGPYLLLLMNIHQIGKLRSLMVERVGSESTLVHELQMTVMKSTNRDLTQLELLDLMLINFELEERSSSDAGITALMQTPEFATSLEKVIEKLADQEKRSVSYLDFMEKLSPEESLNKMSRFQLLLHFLTLFEKHPNFWTALKNKTQLKTLVTRIASETAGPDHYGPKTVLKARSILMLDLAIEF